MSTRTVIVTGANSGIGYEAAAALLKSDPDLTVVVAGRDRSRIATASARLDRRRALPRVLNLNALASIDAFVAGVKGDLASGALPPLHAIICNAGVQVIGPTRFSDDGYEQTFATNHLGHYALVLALLDSLSPDGRVIVVSSDTHDPARRTGMPAPRYGTASELARGKLTGDIGGEPLKIGRIRYTTSKLCNLLFAHELDRRLRLAPNESITVNAFNPGLTPGTGLARHYPAPMRLAFRHILPLVARLTGRLNVASDQGRALARLAIDGALDGTSGAYFSGLDPDIPSAESRDADKAAELWRTSAALVAKSSSALYKKLTFPA